MIVDAGASSGEPGGGESAASVREAASLLKDPVEAAPAGAATGSEPGDEEAHAPAADAGAEPSAGDDSSQAANVKASAKSAGEKASAVAADAAEQAKQSSRKARKRIASAASDAKDRASTAASASRDKAAATDVHEIAAKTSGLIDNTRPFFLAGCALIFALLGFFEGDSGVGQFFVFGAILFVLGAAFSTELTQLFQGRRRRDEQ